MKMSAVLSAVKLCEAELVIFHVFPHEVLMNVDMLGSLVKGGLFARAIEYWLSKSRYSRRPALSFVQLCHKPQRMKIYFRISYLLSTPVSASFHIPLIPETCLVSTAVPSKFHVRFGFMGNETLFLLVETCTGTVTKDYILLYCLPFYVRFCV